ncbi:hypothetical protein [Oceanicaulis sp.]|uniref:hypothetical protein n=1 Tax=Oceanicaulis sp. TaxID=1924941 RepID=UPI003F72C036
MSAFVNGIWKSGNNLLLKLCNELGLPTANRGVATHLFYGKGARLRRLIRSSFLDTPIPVGLETPFNVGEPWLRRRLRGAAGTALGGHAAYSSRMVDVLRSEGFQALSIIRDPRDVLVSYARWIPTRPDMYSFAYFNALEERDRIKALITGGAGGGFVFDDFGSVLDRAQGWMHDDRVCHVRFEDLVGASGGGDTSKQLEAVAAIAAALDQKDADLEAISVRLFGGTKTFRAGRIGAWTDVFDDELTELFNASIGARRLALYGYE